MGNLHFPRITRRRFLKLAAGSSLALGAAVAGYTWRIEPHWVEVVRRELPIERLPEPLVGRTLVQISDLHIGPVVDDDYMAGALRSIAPLEPDIVAVTGDFMTYQGEEQIDQAARVLEHLQPGKLATLGVLGNHDYGRRWRECAVADRLADRLRGLGIEILRNACRDLRGLQLVGIDDYWSPCFQPDKVLAGIDRQRAALVFSHNPDTADQPIWAGYQGWILSGHTHGGQCKPPFFQPPLLPVSNRRYTAGEFDLYDGRKLYINRGLGYLWRVRFNVRPEITVFTLKRALGGENSKVSSYTLNG